MIARARSLNIVVAVAMLAGCASQGAGPSTLPNGGVRPLALQSNAPMPTLWQNELFKVYVPILGPDGTSIWSVSNSGGHGVAWRLDIPTDTVQQYQLSGIANHAHAGPDGNLWFCGPNQVGKISATGAVTYYPEPIVNCAGITSGPDGNIWLTDQTSIDRVTTSGQLSTFEIPVVALVAVATSVKDGLLWFEYEASTQSGLGTFNPVTDKYALFPYSSSFGAGGLDTDIDGNAYYIPPISHRPTGLIIRVSPQGVVTRFTNLPRTLENNVGENIYTIWFGSGDSHLYGWNVQSHQLIDDGASPNGVDDPILGPDKNVWFFGGIYLRRLLTVTPQSATLGVGVQQAFSIKETDCQGCVWSAVSSSPSIASVSSVSGGRFTVTGVSSGSTTVTVTQQRNNVVLVPIIVN